MERLTRKSDTSDMVWFIDREHDVEREPYEMDVHHARLAIVKLAEYEDLEEQGKLLKLPCAVGNDEIIKRVLAERRRQDAKWGEKNHSAPIWGMIIGEEYGEMCQAINEFCFNPTPETEEQIYTEAIHTMASCMAMLECMERARKGEGGNNEID